MDKKDKITRTDITLNGIVATYSLKHEGLIQGTYTGQFVFKCFLLPLERLSAAKEKRELLGEHENFATVDEKWLAWALTELKYRILSAPPFWAQDHRVSGNIPDEDLISKVINAAMDAETMYIQQKREEKDNVLKASLKAAEAIVLKKQSEEKDKSEEDKLEAELEEIDDES